MTPSQIVKNCALHIDGIGYAGKVDEITVPKVVEKTEELLAAGMIGTRKMGTGVLEAMEATFISKSILAVFVAQMGGINKRWKLSRALKNIDGTVKAESFVLIGDVHSSEDGTSKPGESATLTVTMDVNHYERYIDGVELIYIDIDTGVYRVNGIDLSADIMRVINS
ncbi:MAG: phage major tail tube protein [Patescibacteria group bacterium]|jgi:hypothetical protein